LFCLLGFLLIVSAFIEIAITLKEHLEKDLEIYNKINNIKKVILKENNWKPYAKSTSDGD
jgi:hypothetical protein